MTYSYVIAFFCISPTGNKVSASFRVALPSLYSRSTVALNRQNTMAAATQIPEKTAGNPNHVTV